ncbi:uncharacterized protein [Bemisia tabaci]|uniref:uncharacterized protein n=1 Tax=Bemisia tabaci TaxID=7038 RepID=UPI003B28182A
MQLGRSTDLSNETRQRRPLHSSEKLTTPYVVTSVENCFKHHTLRQKTAASEKALILIILCHLLSYVCGGIIVNEDTSSTTEIDSDSTTYSTTYSTAYSTIHSTTTRPGRKSKCDVHNVDGRWLSRKLGYDDSPSNFRIKANGDRNGHLYFYYNCSYSGREDGCNDSVTEFSVREAKNGKSCEVEIHSLNMTLRFRMDGEKPRHDHPMTTKMMIVGSVCSVTAFLLVLSFRAVNYLVEI